MDSSFVAGIARHTLLTSAARDGGDPRTALAAFGPLVDHWHGFGAWTQLWIALRALIQTLSELGRHDEATRLLGAWGASARAPLAYGADAARAEAVERAARAALGPAFERFHAEGAALGDAGAIALARRLTREAPPPPGSPLQVGEDLAHLDRPGAPDVEPADDVHGGPLVVARSRGNTSQNSRGAARLSASTPAVQPGDADGWPAGSSVHLRDQGDVVVPVDVEQAGLVPAPYSPHCRCSSTAPSAAPGPGGRWSWLRHCSSPGSGTCDGSSRKVWRTGRSPGARRVPAPVPRHIATSPTQMGLRSRAAAAASALRSGLI